MKVSTFLAALAVVGLAASSALAQSCYYVEDNFDAPLDSRWTVSSDSIVTTTVDGYLDIEFAGTPALTHKAVLEECFYGDFEVSFRCRDLDGTGGKVFGFRTTGLDQVGYGVNFRSTTNDVLLARGPLGTRTILASSTLVHDTGEWLDVSISAIGGQITVYVNNNIALLHNDPNPLLSGAAMLTINAGGTQTAHAQWDDFQITAFSAVANESYSWGSMKALRR